MGARAYILIDSWKPLKDDVVIEIGSERGEGSTEYLKNYCNDNDLDFYSVDINPSIDGVIKADGATWLKSFQGTIGFAYLDNFDYIFDHIKDEDWVKEQIRDYKSLGIDMNNDNSENAHLEQAKLVHKNSRIGTEILFDDTWMQADKYYGKGAKALDFLKNNGYEVNYIGYDYKGYAHTRRVK